MSASVYKLSKFFSKSKFFILYSIHLKPTGVQFPQFTVSFIITIFISVCLNRSGLDLKFLFNLNGILNQQEKFTHEIRRGVAGVANLFFLLSKLLNHTVHYVAVHQDKCCKLEQLQIQQVQQKLINPCNKRRQLPQDAERNSKPTDKQTAHMNCTQIAIIY